MEPVGIITGTVAPLMRANIDTDQIIPKQFLKRVERTGFGPFLFYDWAYDEEDVPRPDFVLNRSEYADARVLVAGHNFGSGSSREHAPWALMDWGLRAVVAPSFADIFRTNCYQNGLLPVILTEEEVATVADYASKPPAPVVIDLEAQTVTAGDLVATFPIDPYVKQSLLQGLDHIDLTLANESAITGYEAARPEFKPRLS